MATTNGSAAGTSAFSGSASSNLAANSSGSAFILTGTATTGTLNQQDITFLQQAETSNLGEIAEGKLAILQSPDPATREFGQWMLTDHASLGMALAGLGQEHGVQLPSALDSQQTTDLQNLGTLSGSAFVQAFAQQEVQDHTAAVTLFQQEISSGSSPELVALARQELPLLQAHLQEAQALASGTATGTASAAAATAGNGFSGTAGATGAASPAVGAGGAASGSGGTGLTSASGSTAGSSSNSAAGTTSPATPAATTGGGASNASGAATSSGSSSGAGTTNAIAPATTTGGSASNGSGAATSSGSGSGAGTTNAIAPAATTSSSASSESGAAAGSSGSGSGTGTAGAITPAATPGSSASTGSGAAAGSSGSGSAAGTSGAITPAATPGSSASNASGTASTNVAPAAAATGASGSASASPTTPTAGAAASPGSSANDTGPALNAQDQQFLQQAASAGLTEVKEGQLAMSQSGNAAGSEFGSWMVADHTALNATLSTIAAQDSATLPSSPTAAQQAEISALQSQTGSSFFNTYISDAVTDHAQTLMQFVTEAQSGQNAALVDFAREAIPVLAEHLKAAMELQTNQLGLTPLDQTPPNVSSLVSSLLASNSGAASGSGSGGTLLPNSGSPSSGSVGSASQPTHTMTTAVPAVTQHG